jgi:hypothetical protein
MSSNYEDALIKKRNEKYGLSKLELTDERKRPTTLDEPKVTPSKIAANRLAELKAKFNLPNGFEVEGIRRKRINTLEDISNQHAIQDRLENSLKIAVGSTTYQNKTVKLWYTVGR